MGWCMRCKAKREIVDGNTFKMKKGQPAIRGKCIKCGTTMVKILTAEERKKAGID